MYKYQIKYGKNFIVYLPLKGLAFIANAPMVNYLADINENPALASDEKNENINFLKEIGYFDPESIPHESGFEINYRPTVAVLCLTNTCNFNCVYCYASAGEQKKEELPVILGKKAIDLVHDNAILMQLNSFDVSFHGGGEPTLLFKKLIELTKYARSKNLPSAIELTSNGYWGKKKLDWVLSNVDRLTISFDGIEKTQNSQRPLLNGQKTFQHVFKNLKKLDENNFSYGIRVTATDQSIEELPKSIEFLCQKTNCQTIQVEPAFSHGRAVKNNKRLTKNKIFVENFMKAYDIACSFGRQIYYSGSRPWVISDIFCSANYNALVVTPEGRLTSCYEISEETHKLAKYFHFGRIEPDKIIIDQNVRKNFAGMIDERKQNCKECFCYWHCAGDCPAKTFTDKKNGHLLSGQRCSVNREITKELILRNIIAGNGIMRSYNKEL